MGWPISMSSDCSSSTNTTAAWRPSLERDPLQRLAADGELMAYRHPGSFYAMDTYREYQYLNDLWTRHEAPWKIWP